MGNPAQLGKICKLMSDNNRTVRSGDQSDWISFHKSQKRNGRSFLFLDIRHSKTHQKTFKYVNLRSKTHFFNKA